MPRQQGITRTLEDRQEIAALLRVAIAHNWNFSYSVTGMLGGAVFNTELLDIDADFQSVTVGSEVKYIGLKEKDQISFRSHSGGLSVKFESNLVPMASMRATSKLLGECRIGFPARVLYTQLRQTVRINFSRLHKIPITLFMSDGSQVTGLVDDLSVTGLRARFNDIKVDKLRIGHSMADCSLLLPDKSYVSARIQLLGALQDLSKETCFLRLRILQFNGDAELKVDELISSSLARIKAMSESSPPLYLSG